MSDSRDWRWFAASCLTAVCAACAQSSSLSETSVVDSVGVRIVTNPSEAVAAAEQWTLSAASVIEIGGGANPEAPLYQVTVVQALGEGRVAVGTNSPAQALVFEADGSLAVTLGREGDGPGEFWNVASLVALASDSILVWDRDRRRISVFTGEGVYSREADLSE